MMKVLLVYTNRYRALASPPAGIAYLVEPLARDGHEVRVLDMMFLADPAGEMTRALDEFGPDVVGFSLRNIDNQDMADTIFFLPADKEYVDMARHRGVVTVLGGTAFTTLPAETLEYMGADYGIAGQGERGLPRLLRSLRRPDETIPGLVWRQEGRVRMNPPDFSGYRAERADWGDIKLDGYNTGEFPGAVVAKTGCPHRCAYCNVTYCFGSRFAFRDPDDIVEEIKALKRTHGIRGFTLTDACFNDPPGYAKGVLKSIARAGLDVRLHTSLVPVPGSYDDEFFELFKAAGGALLSLGTETLSEKMLRSYNKPFTVKDVAAAAGLCHRHGVPFVVHALFGGPGENADTVKETMDALSGIGSFRFEYHIGIRLLPGTAIFETAKKEGLVKDEAELFAPKFYVSKELDVAWADAYIKGRAKEYGL